MTLTPAQATLDYNLYTLATKVRDPALAGDDMAWSDTLVLMHDLCTPEMVLSLLDRAGFVSPHERKPQQKPGYHLREIKKGELGTISKIREELEELEDAAEQGVLLMQLVELSDMLGAVECYLKDIAPSVTMSDLLAMAKVTRRAFESGRRG